MSNRFTVHITRWDAGTLGDWFFITDNENKKKLVGNEREFIEIHRIASVQERSRTEFDYVCEIPGEIAPMPEFVDHYELYLEDCLLWKKLKCRAILTEKGCLRKATENGKRTRYRATPLGPKYY